MLLYVDSELFDTDSLADRAQAALADEEVRLAVAPTVAQAIGEASPEGAPGIDRTAEALADPEVGDEFGAAAAAAAERLFAGGAGDLELNLEEVTATAVSVATNTPSDELGLTPEDFASARIDLIGAPAVLDSLDATERFGWLGLVLLPVGVIFLLLSVGASWDRLRGVASAAVALGVVALLLLAALYAGREVVEAQFDDELTREAVGGALEALLGDLRTGAIVTIAVCVLAAIGASVAASRRDRAR